MFLMEMDFRGEELPKVVRVDKLPDPTIEVYTGKLGHVRVVFPGAKMTVSELHTDKQSCYKIFL